MTDDQAKPVPLRRTMRFLFWWTVVFGIGCGVCAAWNAHAGHATAAALMAFIAGLDLGSAMWWRMSDLHRANAHRWEGRSDEWRTTADRWRALYYKADARTDELRAELRARENRVSH